MIDGNVECLKSAQSTRRSSLMTVIVSELSYIGRPCGPELRILLLAIVRYSRRQS